MNCWPVTLTWSSWPRWPAPSRCRAGRCRRRRTGAIRSVAGIAGPDDLEARVAVDRRAVELLLAGAHPEPDRPRRARPSTTSTKIGIEHDQQDVPERVDLARPAWRPLGGNQSIGSATAIPMIDAMTPTTTARSRSAAAKRLCLAPCRRASYVLGATNVTCAPARPCWPRLDSGGGANRRPAADGHRGGGCGSRRRQRRGGAGTPWRTGPAGGSRRAGRPRGRSATRAPAARPPLHANARQMLAERRVADLGVGALQLAPRRRDAAGDVVEREVARRTRRRRSRRPRRRGWCEVGRCLNAVVASKALTNGVSDRMRGGTDSFPSWRIGVRCDQVGI